MKESQLLPVILSGGSGTRLWPLSTARQPKQFLALTGSRSMLQLALERVADRQLFDPPLVVANPAHASLIEQQVAEAGAGISGLILEPQAKNTAPAIALAALATEASQLLLVMPSDHLIQDTNALKSALDVAIPLASEDWLVTFGIRPAKAETAYGYIKRGRELAPGAFVGERFVEKPDAATAARYVGEGGYDWNAGIFLFRAGAYLDALALHAPEMFSAAQAAMSAAARSGVQIRPDGECFAKSPAQSVDYAVMEKADRVAVIPVEMAWSDVGSWDALHDVSQPDENGNCTAGAVLAIDAQNCLLRSQGPRLVAIGVSDLIVIATDDALLIVPRGDSQRVKEAVDRLSSSDSALATK
jgi:mannose-1-phosphate guanylyltransferase